MVKSTPMSSTTLIVPFRKVSSAKNQQSTDWEVVRLRRELKQVKNALFIVSACSLILMVAFALLVP